MSDLDERLRASAVAWQDAVDHGASPLTMTRTVQVSRPAPRTRSRVLAPAFSLLAVLAVVAGVVVAATATHRVNTPAASSPVGTSPERYGGAVFHLPTAWRVTDALPGGVLIELTDGRAVTNVFPGRVWTARSTVSCPGHSTRPCVLRVKFAPRNGMVVFVEGIEASDSASFNVRLRGLPARFDGLQAASCVGSKAESDVSIRTTRQTTVALHACFGPNSDEVQRQYHRVLHTITRP